MRATLANRGLATTVRDLELAMGAPRPSRESFYRAYPGARRHGRHSTGPSLQEVLLADLVTDTIGDRWFLALPPRPGGRDPVRTAKVMLDTLRARIGDDRDGRRLLLHALVVAPSGSPSRQVARSFVERVRHELRALDRREDGFAAEVAELFLAEVLAEAHGGRPARERVANAIELLLG